LKTMIAKIKVKLPKYWKFWGLLAVFSAVFAAFYLWGIRRQNNYFGKELYKEITVPKGFGVEDIAVLLKKEDLINSKGLFKLYVLLGRRSLQAGKFIIPTNASVVEVADLFGKGSFQEKVTFIEGWRIEQMAQILPKAAQMDFLKSAYTKEGFMFPDTYFFYNSVSGEDIAKTLRQNFDEKISPFEDKIKESGFSLDEVVILSSIVEREARSFEDKAAVAGILIKRYRNSWPLQADAAIQYAKDLNESVCSSAQDCAWWDILSAADLEIDSPFNTYKYAGLPPAPICNPGLDAIKAVLEYKETDYWFYLTGSNGVTHFSKTIQEHNDNIKKYL